MRPKIAFALGGLAGNNAHGAGFLQAALDNHVEPVIISCTSGQIRWVARYLQAKQSESNQPILANFLSKELFSLKKTGEINTDVALLGLLGKKDTFQPSYLYFFPDLLRNIRENFSNLMSGKGLLFVKQVLSLIPARTLMPETDHQLYETMSELFNNTSIGITFNAYNPVKGIEYVFLNQAARQLLWDSTLPNKYQDDDHNPYRPYRHYKDITPQAIKEALWLYQYGFTQDEAISEKVVDGVYFRDVMLAELSPADIIFSVRPINQRWLGTKLPTNYLELEDLKTVVSFNSCYAAERSQIEIINSLLDKNLLTPTQGKGYHRITVVDLEIQIQRDYFDYILESQTVFDQAKQMAVSHFQQYNLI